MSLVDKAYNLVEAYPGGAVSLAPRMDKVAGVLSAEVARRGTAKFGLDDALKVTQFSGDYRILHAFAEACGQMCIPLPGFYHSDEDDVLQALGSASAEFSALCQEVCRSMGDGDITDNELTRIERERSELMARLHKLGEAIITRNLRGKPARVRTAPEAQT